jgi:hypothetical protein
MLLKDKIQSVLREHYGEFNTDLELEYEQKLTEVLILGDLSKKEAWATYNQIVLELKNNVKDINRLKELQYYITDGCNPKYVCLRILYPIKNKSKELQRLYDKISNF